VHTPFSFSLFTIYCEFVQSVLPEYQLDPQVIPSTTMAFIQKAFGESLESQLIHEMILRQFLIRCQALTFDLIAHSSLSKTAYLHNELVMAARLIETHELSVDLANFCDILIGEALDVYQSAFTNVISTGFWGKTKSIEEVINALLKKELTYFRLLNPYSLEILSVSMLRRAMDQAPPVVIATLTEWGGENGIKLN
jgi:hypothetical protein